MTEAKKKTKNEGVFCRIVLKDLDSKGRRRTLYATLRGVDEVGDLGDRLFFPSLKGDQLEVPKANIDHVEYWPVDSTREGRNARDKEEVISINSTATL